MKTKLKIFIGVVLIFWAGYSLGAYVSRVTNKELKSLMESEALRLICDTSYQQDKDLLRYYMRLEDELHASGNDKAANTVSEINALLEKKVAAYEKNCQ